VQRARTVHEDRLNANDHALHRLFDDQHETNALHHRRSNFDHF
jgi:hypothetical protein